ncbi:MAG: hypothetical protein WCW33_01910 [Candidatus Babeliales bacterium]
MKKNLHILSLTLVAIWRFSSLLSMEADNTPLIEANKKQAVFTNAIKNGDVQLIKWLLQKKFHPEFAVEDSTRTPLGLACECLNDKIRHFNMQIKEPESAWHGCCGFGCLKKTAGNIETFKEIIFLLADRIKPNFSDQISIEVTLEWLTGPYEDKELSDLLQRLLPPKIEGLGYQT